jgi:very-short-patch-repair endonuclease
MSLPYEHKLIARAKKLRKEATRQENHLWYDYLRSYPIRFQRQKSIGDYIVDFYCHQCKLIIELDGSQHYEDDAKDYDQRRTAFFHELGLSVFRIPNIEIDRNFQGVCEAIDQRVNSLSQLR